MSDVVYVVASLTRNRTEMKTLYLSVFKNTFKRENKKNTLIPNAVPFMHTSRGCLAAHAARIVVSVCVVLAHFFSLSLMLDIWRSICIRVVIVSPFVLCSFHFWTLRTQLINILNSDETNESKRNC